MLDAADVFLRKAQESLAGAESEAANARYNNCANRCYYACFQAAVSALLRAGIRPPGAHREWSHAFVPAQFAGQLITRRKRYPIQLRDTLGRAYRLRQIADYEEQIIPQVQAARMLRRAEEFVRAIIEREGADR